MLIPEPERARTQRHVPATLDAVPVYAGAADRGLDLRDLFTAVRRNFLGISLAAIAFGFVGYGVGILLPASYQAEALMVIDTQELAIPELQGVRSARTVEPWGGRSVARVLTSADLVRETVEHLSLQYDPSFNPTLRTGIADLLLRQESLPEFVRAPLRGAVSEPVTDASILPEIIDGVRDNLVVESAERDYSIALNFTGHDPEGTARFLNALMERYQAREIEGKRGPAGRALNELRRQVDELFADLELTRSRIRTMETQGELLTTGSDTISAQQLADISAERRQLTSQRSAVSGELAQIRAARESGQVSVPNAGRETPRLRTLWDAESQIRREITEREVEFGANHPQMRVLRRELEENRMAQLAEIDAIEQGILRELAVLDQREQQLTTRQQSASSDAAVSAEGRAVIDQLRAEEASKLALYNEYRQQFEQARASQELINADVRIVSRAAPPHKPSSPSPMLLAAAGTMLGGMGAFAFVVGRRFLHDGMESLEDAGRVTGLPALGGIPKVTPSWGRGHRVAEHVASNPRSAITETVRGILFRIQNPGQGRPAPRVVMITSPMPRDGKTSLVTSMARVAARDGLKVLAIDGDFRKPALADAINVRPRWWLNDYLDGNLELGDAVVQDPKGSAHLLLSRVESNCSRKFLEQPRLRALIAGARDLYDLVLIDSPPVMKVVDPLVLAQHADATVLVVSWREVSRQIVRESIERIETTPTPLIGLVMSRVGGKVPENYVYGGYGEAA